MLCTVYLHLLFLLLPARSRSAVVTQWGNRLTVAEGKTAEMHCFQNDTNENYMYWYRQHSGAGLQLIVTSVGTSDSTPAEGFKERFKATRPDLKTCSLKILRVDQTDRAVYYCAASDHSDSNRSRAASKTYHPLILITERFNRKEIFPPLLAFVKNLSTFMKWKTFNGLLTVRCPPAFTDSRCCAHFQPPLCQWSRKLHRIPSAAARGRDHSLNGNSLSDICSNSICSHEICGVLRHLLVETENDQIICFSKCSAGGYTNLLHFGDGSKLTILETRVLIQKCNIASGNDGYTFGGNSKLMVLEDTGFEAIDIKDQWRDEETFSHRGSYCDREGISELVVEVGSGETFKMEIDRYSKGNIQDDGKTFHKASRGPMGRMVSPSVMYISYSMTLLVSHKFINGNIKNLIVAFYVKLKPWDLDLLLWLWDYVLDWRMCLQLPEPETLEFPPETPLLLSLFSFFKKHLRTYFFDCSPVPNIYFDNSVSSCCLSCSDGENDTIRPAKVTVFEPSPEEIREKKKATVVCLVSDFYPDNIKIHWLVDGKEKDANDTNIHTDLNAILSKENTSYSISSRLRFDALDWARSKNVECRVDLYTNESVPATSSSTLAVKAEMCGISKEAKIQSMATAKLTYLILICKSIFYTIFISTIAWKTKTSYSKRFD
ncbi:uncharacterized protein [Heterodontus francisci]|uniref:uncharacterized protein n=1 Tax=Heterodontus francisci TaxID=7792 RepID=UPI00355B513F